MTILDHVTIALLLLVVIYRLYLFGMSFKIEKIQGSVQEAWAMLTVGCIVLILRYILAVLDVQWPNVIQSPVLKELLLAIASGAFAAAGIAYLRLPTGPKVFETTNYYVTWEFTDSAMDGMLTMTYTVEFDRTNISNKEQYGWRGGGFETYLWSSSSDYKIEWVRCAPYRQAFYGYSDQVEYQNIPFIKDGKRITIDTSMPGNRAAVIQPDGKSWYSWKGSVDVPMIYSDQASGSSEFVGEAVFEVHNKVKNSDIVFALISRDDERRIETNYENNIDIIKFPIRVDKPQSSRYLLLWCPRDKVTSDFQNIIK